MLQKWNQWEELVRNAIENDSSLSIEDVTDSIDEVIKIVFNVTKQMSMIHDNETPSKTSSISLRRALRYCLSLFRLRSLRISLQERLIDVEVHKHLARIIVHCRSDEKSCCMASKLICNIGTSNEKSARRILNDIKPSFIGGTICSDVNVDISWSDMIYFSGVSGNRNVLAVIVASIYNCICSIEDDSTSRIYICSIAGDSILMCNLVRYILPCSVLHNNQNKSETDQSDSVTEWIQMLIEKISTIGLFRKIYKSLGPQNTSSLLRISPEQIILLHCIASEFDDYSKRIHTCFAKKLHPLAGSCESYEKKQNLTFLANEWMKLSADVIESADKGNSYEGENEVVKEASNLIIEIISDAICAYNDQKSCNDLRESDGINRMLCVVIMRLGRQVDQMCMDYRGVNARELKMSNDEQKLITNLVRFIGNVCYKCKTNQDIVRDTSVPVPNMKYDNSQESGLLQSEALMHQDNRNGLHVLLSCASYAYGCFTLREWVIVAIRNALEDNHLNQEIVSDLEAKQVLNSPELQGAGVKVVLDERGKVKVTHR